MTSQILSFLIILVSLAGLLLSFYIFEKKRKKEVMVCLLNADCETVVHSDYSKFLGMRVEILGIIYYSLILLCYSISALLPGILRPGFSLALLSITTTAFLFSIYLTFIQAFALREWCSWCLTSAIFCTVIFSIATYVSTFTFMEMLSYNGAFFVVLRLAAIALGVGTATIGDIFFLASLKDFKISVSEANIIRWFGQISWVALLVAVLTDIAIYLPNISVAESSSKWTAQFVILLALILNSAFFYLVISPKLVSISFEAGDFESEDKDRLKKWAFALGALSLVSWYSLLILSSALDFGFKLPYLIFGFISVALVAIFISQVVESLITKKAEERLGNW